MKNINDFAFATANIPALSNHDVQLNNPFCVSIALQFLAKFPQIKLVNTITAGYNSYMTLHIPAEHLENFKLSSGFDDFNNLENFMPLENNNYHLYTNFSELSENI
jgi:hypothetical protein